LSGLTSSVLVLRWVLRCYFVGSRVIGSYVSLDLAPLGLYFVGSYTSSGLAFRWVLCSWVRALCRWVLSLGLALLGLASLCFVGSCFVGSCFVGSYFVGSYFVRSYFVGSCFIWSYFVGSCFVGSCFVVSLLCWVFILINKKIYFINLFTLWTYIGFRFLVIIKYQYIDKLNDT